MRIWVDADACPKIIKEILYRAALRTETKLILVANQMLSIPSSIFISSIQVSAGFDVVDNYIVKHLLPGELVITEDIPLADAIITKGGLVLSTRGEWYSNENIKHRLSLRNFSHDLRSSGQKVRGPMEMNKRQIQSFANFLDSFLAQQKKMR